MRKNREIKRIALIEPAMPDSGLLRGPGFREDMENMGLMYIESKLLSEGYEVKTFIQSTNESKNFVDDILSFEPEMVGFSFYSANFDRATDIANEIKGKDGRIITVSGGTHATLAPEETAEYFDYTVVGEGEYTVVALIKALENDKNLDAIKGLAFYSDGKLTFKDRSERITDLDSLPVPTRNPDYARTAIGQTPFPSDKRGFSSIVASRGCYNSCTFCSNHKIWCSKTVYRSPKNVVDEMDNIYRNYGVNYFWFADSNFTSNREWVREFCENIIHRDLNIYWTIMGRVTDVDDDVLSLMKQAGCWQIGYGIETADEESLKQYKKNITLNMVKSIIDLTNEHGILTTGFFMVGSPYDTEETLHNTKIFILEELNVVRLRLSFVYPTIGTDLREYVDRDNLWVSEDYKKHVYATTELPTIKCGVSPDYLVEYTKDMLQDYYRSEKFKSLLDTFSRKDDHMRRSMKIWSGIIHEAYGLK